MGLGSSIKKAVGGSLGGILGGLLKTNPAYAITKTISDVAGGGSLFGGIKENFVAPYYDIAGGVTDLVAGEQEQLPTMQSALPGGIGGATSLQSPETAQLEAEQTRRRRRQSGAYSTTGGALGDSSLSIGNSLLG